MGGNPVDLDAGSARDRCVAEHGFLTEADFPTEGRGAVDERLGVRSHGCGPDVVAGSGVARSAIGNGRVDDTCLGHRQRLHRPVHDHGRPGVDTQRGAFGRDHFPDAVAAEGKAAGYRQVVVADAATDEESVHAGGAIGGVRGGHGAGHEPCRARARVASVRCRGQHAGRFEVVAGLDLDADAQCDRPLRQDHVERPDTGEERHPVRAATRIVHPGSTGRT